MRGAGAADHRRSLLGVEGAHFSLIEAADLDAALGWAARVTAAIHAPIEVRPLAGFAA
jgi:hypothetical protein